MDHEWKARPLLNTGRKKKKKKDPFEKPQRKPWGGVRKRRSHADRADKRGRGGGQHPSREKRFGGDGKVLRQEEPKQKGGAKGVQTSTQQWCKGGTGGEKKKKNAGRKGSAREENPLGKGGGGVT